MKIRSKVKFSKRKKSLKIEDIIFAPGKKVLSLKEKVWRIELRIKDIKNFFENNRRYLLIGLVVLVFTIGMIGYWVVTKANIINLYPNFCLGDWRNPQNAAGLPNLPSGAEINLFNEENSAVFEGGLKQIFCGDFKSEISEGEIKKVKLKFSLAVKQKGEGAEVLPAFTEQTQNLLPIPASTSSEEQLIIPPTPPPAETPQETTPIEEIKQEESQQEENSILESTSFLFKIFKTVFAQTTQDEPNLTPPSSETPQETTTSPEEIFQAPSETIEQSTSSSETPQETTPSIEQSTSSFEQPSIEPQPIIEYSLEGESWQLVSQNNNLLEISYTLDAQNWQSLGQINKENWQNLIYEIPIADWNNLSKIQIKIQSLPFLGESLVVYLDGMWLEVEYEKISKEEELSPEEIEKLPRIKLENGKIFKFSKKDFQANEEPRFEINISSLEVEYLKEEAPPASESLPEQPSSTLEPSPETSPEPSPEAEPENKIINFFKKFIPIAFAKTSKVKIVKTEIFNPKGEKIDVQPIIQETKGEIKISIPKPTDSFQPGKYKMRVEILVDRQVFVSTQGFTWGVLVINVNKSIYTLKETTYLQMTVLRDDGHTVCDAKLRLQILNPKFEILNLSTEDGTIQYSGKCGLNNVTDVPDYFAYYQVGEAGRYEMKLINLDNGYEIIDSFEVRELVPFDVERIGATRINPFLASYVMNIKIKANQDFKGEIIEYLPASFEILSSEGSRIEQKNNRKEIIWEKSFKAGEIIELKYEYQAPEISPQFYLLGPLQFSASKNWLGELLGPDEKLVFQEARQWQIAADAAPTFQAFSAIAASTGADVTVTLPAHQANDIFLLEVIVRDQDDTITWPSGWTQINTVNRSTVSKYWWAWKRAASSAETNPLIDKSTATGDTYAAVITYRGAITTSDPWEVKGTPQTGTADPMVLTGITTLTANSLVVVAVAGEDNNNASIITTGTDPAAYNEHYVESNIGGDGVITFSEAARASAGATGNVSVDWNTAIPIGDGGILLALKPVPPITTIADGTNPGNATIGPGSGITDLDAFTLQTNNGTDSVTALTVTLTGLNSFESLSEVRITSDDGATLYFAAVAPTSNTVSFSGGTPIPVSATLTQFKVRITPKSHAAMPAPPGSEYNVGGTVTSFTSTNTQAGTDSASAIITVDNLSPNGATAISGTAGDANVTLNWTTSNSSDFNTTSGSVMYRWTGGSAGSEVPAEGSTATIGGVNGTATAACVVSSSASTALSRIDGTGGSADCTTSVLTNGQAYTYKIFQKDTNGNYDVGVLVGTFTPAASTVITVGTTGTQVSSMNIPSTNNNVGGAFTFVRNAGTASVSQIIITDTGTVNANLNLSNLVLFYKTEATCSTSIPADATQYNSTGVGFNTSEKATVTGTMTVGTSQICLYVRLNVGSGATGDQTLEIEISNPSTEVTVSAGSVTPNTAVAIAGTTNLVIPPNVVQLHYRWRNDNGGE